jgi:hypothetical protein
MPPAWTDPCHGHFTHEQTRGKCPIEVVANNRVITTGRRSAIVGGVLPSALLDTVSSSDIAFLNVADHSVDQEFDYDTSTVQQIFDAVRGGIINPGEAMAELGGRIPAAVAADQATLGYTIGAIENLVKVGQVSKNSLELSGNLLRLWACITKKIKKLTGPVMVVDANLISLAAEGQGENKSKFSVDRLTTETLFDAAVYQWSLMAHSMGVMTFEISSHFVFEVVHLIRLKHGESFWTAQEYFIACLDLLDRKKVKVSAVPNYDRGILLADARRYGEHFSAGASKVGAPTEAHQAKVKWNKEFQAADNPKIPPCPYFNTGKEHDPKHLTNAGKCIFRHVCNHWVTGIGTKGRCEATDHGWRSCTNADKCDDPVA